MAATKIVKKTIVKTPAKVVQEFSDIIQLKAALKMCSEEELTSFLVNLSPEQINLIIDEIAPIAIEIDKLKKEIKEKEKSMQGLDKTILQIMELKRQKNVVTSEGYVSEVTEGRATSTFTTTVAEFIDLAKDAGHSDVIDEMLSIKKTEAEKYLGKSLVNKITQTEKKEYGGIRFSCIRN